MIANTLGPQFVDKVFNDYLFSVPTISSKNAWPVCRGPAARKQGLQLLYHLTEPGSDNDGGLRIDRSLYAANRLKLAELVKKYRCSVPMDKIGWKTSPNNIRKETAFAGLVNQGCTCYMNATLQQLYLIRSIRDNVLSAPLSPIISSRCRDLIDFEAMFASPLSENSL